LRSLLAFTAVIVAVFFLCSPLYAEDPPYGVVKTQMEESVVINDYIGGYQGFYYDGNELKSANSIFNPVRSAEWYAQHPIIPITGYRYAMTFWNIGAMGYLEAYADAQLTIEAITESAWICDLVGIDWQGLPTCKEKSAGNIEIHAEKIELKFSGGPYGEFTTPTGTYPWGSVSDGKSISISAPYGPQDTGLLKFVGGSRQTIPIEGDGFDTWMNILEGKEKKRYVIAPGLQEGEGVPWGTVHKIFIDGKEITDFEKAPLFNGSQIKTGPGVEIVIRDSGGAWTRVTEDTQYEVKTATPVGPTLQGVYGRLIKGISEFYWPPGYEFKKKFGVSTRRVSIGIKGTTFTVSHIFDMTTVEVEEGIVEATDLLTEKIHTVSAGNRLSFGDNCLSVDENLGISIPHAEYDDIPFSFDLDYFPNPSDPANLYWKMDLSTLAAETTIHSIPINGDFGITIPCAECCGTFISFELDYFPNASDPSGLYWKMDLDTLSLVQKASSTE